MQRPDDSFLDGIHVLVFIDDDVLDSLRQALLDIFLTVQHLDSRLHDCGVIKVPRIFEQTAIGLETGRNRAAVNDSRVDIRFSKDADCG